MLFDLDGVLTDTASLHAACWKQVFDELLKRRAKEQGESFRPFEIETDYRRYVDGKARLDGVRDFLASRNMKLPEGSQHSPADEESVYGIAQRKDALFERALRDEGPKVFEGSVRWLRRLRDEGFRTAVVSASHHCSQVLRATGLDTMVDAEVDGKLADRLALRGKPAPDAFLEAARQLGVQPQRCVVVEDAVAGVQAGRAGGFGLVIGVARQGQREELTVAGADLVVSDFEEMLP